MQARAAGVEPEAAMNPVLLKPGSDRRSHVVPLGQPFGDARSAGVRDRPGRPRRDRLRRVTTISRARYDVVVCEGAGSPAEINLRGGDYVNLGLARRFGAARRRRRRHRPRRGARRDVRHARAALDARTRRWSRAASSTSSAATSACCARAWTCSSELTGRPVLGVLPWLDRRVARLRGRPRRRRAGAGRPDRRGRLARRGGPVPARVQRHRRRRAGRRTRRRRCR